LTELTLICATAEWRKLIHRTCGHIRIYQNQLWKKGWNDDIKVNDLERLKSWKLKLMNKTTLVRI